MGCSSGVVYFPEMSEAQGPKRGKGMKVKLVGVWVEQGRLCPRTVLSLCFAKAS